MIAKKNNKLITSVILSMLIILAMIPSLAFADQNLVDYTGLQQGTTSTRIYMLNCGNLETLYPNVFGDNNNYTSRWNIKTDADVTDHFENYITDKPDASKKTEFVFSIGGSGMNHLDITDPTFRKGITDYLTVTDTAGNSCKLDVDMVFTPHSGSGGGTGGGPSRAVDVIVKIAPDTLQPATAYRFAIMSGLSSGRDALNKDIYFNFTTAPVIMQSIVLEDTELTLDKGSDKTLKVKEILPANTTDKTLIWESSDKNVVSVDENGKITAVDKGTAQITVRSADGGASAVCNVKVSIPAAGNDKDKNNDKDNKTGTDTKITKTTENSSGNGKAATGDEMNITLYVIVMMSSLAVIAFVLFSTYHRRTDR